MTAISISCGANTPVVEKIALISGGCRDGTSRMTLKTDVTSSSWCGVCCVGVGVFGGVWGCVGVFVCLICFVCVCVFVGGERCVAW